MNTEIRIYSDAVKTMIVARLANVSPEGLPGNASESPEARRALRDATGDELELYDLAREADRLINTLRDNARSMAERFELFARNIDREAYVANNPAAYSTIADLLRDEAKLEATLRGLMAVARTVFGGEGSKTFRKIADADRASMAAAWDAREKGTVSR